MGLIYRRGFSLFSCLVDEILNLIELNWIARCLFVWFVALKKELVWFPVGCPSSSQPIFWKRTATRSSLAFVAQLGINVGDLRDCSEQLKDGTVFFWFLVLPKVFFCMTLGSCLISLVIISHFLIRVRIKSHNGCKAVVFCACKYAINC